MPNRKVIVFIAASLDGYIAKPNDDLSFLNIVEQHGEDYGYKNFVEQTDTVIMGRKTYDWLNNQGVDFPHTDKQTFVITRTKREPINNIVFYNEDLKILINKLKNEEGKNIFIDGGADVIAELLKEQLIDEIIVSIIPILVGSGIRLFKDDRPEQKATLIAQSVFKSGLVQLHYRLMGY